MGEFLLGLVLGAMFVPMLDVMCKLFRRRPIIDKKQYPDWSDIPSQGQYMAIDKDGWIKWFRTEPIIGGLNEALNEAWITGDGEGMTPGVDFGLLWKSETMYSLPPWRESLRQRPKE